MHAKSLRYKLHCGGIPCHTQNFQEMKLTDRCENCQIYGHNITVCKFETKCKFCAANHPSTGHFCNTCKTNGECGHAKCANCAGNHTANFQKCEKRLQAFAKQKEFLARKFRNQDAIEIDTESEL
jgi:hypothetical protein